MEFNLQPTSLNLHQPAIINVQGVDELEAEIKKLSAEMQKAEVNEENLQHYKKLLAEVRKRWSTVDRQRIDIKNEVMQPYNVLNDQLAIIKRELLQGEAHIKQQIDIFKENALRERYNEIKTMYEDQREAYKAPHWLHFEDFIKRNPSLYTNSSTSNKKKVEAITRFFDEYLEDYEKVKQQYPYEDDRTAILLSYSTNGFDMQSAVGSFENMKAEKERLRRLQEEKASKVKISIGAKPKSEKKVKKVLIEIDEKDLTQLTKYGIVFNVIKK